MNITFFLKKVLRIINLGKRIVIKLILIDQISKWCFIIYLRDKRNLSINITEFLDLVYSWNYGMSFGLFREYYQYSNRIFMILNSMIVGYLWYILINCKSFRSFIGYSFLIGGAMGNLIDRIIHGAVFDFIFFHIGNKFAFPIFNLADSCICFGCLMILLDYYQNQKKSS